MRVRERRCEAFVAYGHVNSSISTDRAGGYGEVGTESDLCFPATVLYMSRHAETIMNS